VLFARRIFKFPNFNDPDALLPALVRIASASILVILTLSAIAVYQISSREVIRDARETAIKVSRVMYEQQKDVLASLDSDGKYRLLHPDQANTHLIDRYFRSYLHNFNILKIKIYSPSKEIIYSSDGRITGMIDSGNLRLDRALMGEVDSHMEKKDRMLDLSEEAKFNVSVVETYIPISPGNKTIGVFEIYTDVTTYSNEIIHIVAVTLIWLTAILLLVFACSYLVIRKATGLIKEVQQSLAEKVEQLEDALASVKQLEGIIPICSWCKKIRDDEKSWHQLEQYISSHSEAKFSHGICPECYDIQMKEIENM